MRYSLLQREGLVDLLGGRQKPLMSLPTEDPRDLHLVPGGLLAVWEEAPNRDDLPVAFVLSDGDVREFLAFCATYIGTYAPFTAFFRVLSKSDFDEIQQTGAKNNGRAGRIEKRYRALIGAVVAETYIQIEDYRRSLNDITISACLGTYSAAAVKGIALGYDYYRILKMGGAWGETRKLLHRDEHLALPGQALARFWAIICAGLGDKEAYVALESKPTKLSWTLVDAVEGIVSEGTIPLRFWRRIEDALPELRNIRDDMAGTKEDRVLEFDRLLSYVANSKATTEDIKEFVLGYLMVLISNGQTRYISLGANIPKELKSSLLWFGLLNASHSESDIFSEGGGLGRRLVRNLLEIQPPLKDVARDIGFNEFELLHGGRPQQIKFRTEHLNQVAIELFPNVVSRFRISRSTREDSPEAPMSTLAADNLKDALDLLQAAQMRIRDAVKMAQPDLFRPSKENQRSPRDYRKR